MVKIIQEASVIKAAGNKPKEIREFIGNVNSGNSDVSIVYMKSPAGWEEQGHLIKMLSVCLFL